MKRAARIALRTILATPAIVCLLLAVWVVVELSWKPAYDLDDPDYVHLEQQLRSLAEDMAEALRNGDDDSKVFAVDVARLNNGLWTKACFFGGDSYPTLQMRNRGAAIAPADKARFDTAARRGFRFAEVAENEAVIAYVTRDGSARFLHFPISFSPWGPGLKACATKPDTMIRLW